MCLCCNDTVPYQVGDVVAFRYLSWRGEDGGFAYNGEILGFHREGGNHIIWHVLTEKGEQTNGLDGSPSVAR